MYKAANALELYINDCISNDMLREKAFSILPRSKFKKVIAFIKKIKIDDKAYEWEYHNKQALTYRMNLRELLININFKSKTKDDPLMKAINFLRETINADKPFSRIESAKFPQSIIPPKLKRYIYETQKITIGKRTIKQKTINPDRYEFLIYQLLVLSSYLCN